MESRNPGGKKVDLLREPGASTDECCLNGVFQANLFWEEADISRHSWFASMGQWWMELKVGLEVRITVVTIQEILPGIRVWLLAGAARDPVSCL